MCIHVDYKSIKFPTQRTPQAPTIKRGPLENFGHLEMQSPCGIDAESHLHKFCWIPALRRGRGGGGGLILLRLITAGGEDVAHADGGANAAPVCVVKRERVSELLQLREGA